MKTDGENSEVSLVFVGTVKNTEVLTGPLRRPNSSSSPGSSSSITLGGALVVVTTGSEPAAGNHPGGNPGVGTLSKSWANGCNCRPTRNGMLILPRGAPASSRSKFTLRVSPQPTDEASSGPPGPPTFPSVILNWKLRVTIPVV